jgi:hypothetical protein
MVQIELESRLASLKMAAGSGKWKRDSWSAGLGGALWSSETTLGAIEWVEEGGCGRGSSSKSTSSKSDEASSDSIVEIIEMLSERSVSCTDDMVARGGCWLRRCEDG